MRRAVLSTAVCYAYARSKQHTQSLMSTIRSSTLHSRILLPGSDEPRLLSDADPRVEESAVLYSLQEITIPFPSFACGAHIRLVHRERKPTVQGIASTRATLRFKEEIRPCKILAVSRFNRRRVAAGLVTRVGNHWKFG